jgi:hypothetical protein
MQVKSMKLTTWGQWLGSCVYGRQRQGLSFHGLARDVLVGANSMLRCGVELNSRSMQEVHDF